MSVSQGFLENVTLLLLTALVTGFAVPFVLKSIEERRAREQKRIDAERAREQKRFEAELAQQGKVIEAQVKLIEDLARLLWDFQCSALNVFFYKNVNQHLYEKHLANYQENAGEKLGKIRAEISKSIRLAPSDIYEDLIKLYHGQLVDFDNRLGILTEGPHHGSKEWTELWRFADNDMSKMIDQVINRLATELHLKAGP
jgi:hypothetical protein